ncbi:MAG: dihydroxyacetone kinase family protein [Actinomycetales bacterium]
MTLILNRREDFAAQALAGLVQAYPTRVRLAPGGVVRATRRRPGKVSVVVGGGSGHYPAFAGIVGTGLADGAVCGDVFASPSTQQVMDICRAVDTGAGVWLSFGNYAGDVLNFGAAASRLRAQGMSINALAVTDDVASAEAGEEHRRRGVAGDLVVFKVAGAAAEQGYDLAAVTEVAARANERTRSFGVAFDGCTLPGADQPLFTVPQGRMAIGLGIHGEPGIAEADLPTSAGLAELLVERLLTDAPAGGGTRVAALLNGLGTVKYEELFVLWQDVQRLLRDKGFELVGAEVGELVTSLDMAGVSLTISWLDEEIEGLWLAPCDTPAFRRTPPEELDPSPLPEGSRMAAVIEAGPDGQAAGRRVLVAITAIEALLREREDDYARLDTVAGDGDHGRGMARGAGAALLAATAAVEAGGDGPTVLRHAAEAWADRAGGTSGALWGAGLLGVAGALPADALITAESLVAGVSQALTEVTSIGGAQPGDKTLVDALVPFAGTLSESFASAGDLAEAWAAAADAATRAAAETAQIPARLGRSRVLGSKSLGTPDPGATSLADITGTLLAVVARPTS